MDWNKADPVLRRFYGAVNQLDLGRVEECLDLDVSRREFEGSTGGGVYRGRAAVLAKIAEGRGGWAEGTCEPESFELFGDRVVVFVHVLVRLKDSPDWIDARFADGFVVRDGQIVEYHSFGQRDEALEWARAGRRG